MVEERVSYNNIMAKAGLGFDKRNAIIAGLVFLITFVVYFKTKAPTFSFWDCGELIACSYILGIPHPPGSPLYIIVGRLFSAVPIASDIAVRINILSVLSSAMSALFGYLITVRLIRFWFANRADIYARLIAYIGGFTGALFMAFANTTWSNSVEAEVYSVTMMLMMVIYWLTLKYLERRETIQGGTLMLLTAFLTMLGVGIHLTLFVIMPVLVMYFILKKESGTREWALVGLFFLVELLLIFLLSSRPREIPYYFPVLVMFIIFIFHTAMTNNLGREVKITLALFLVSLYPFYFVIMNEISENMGGKGLSALLFGVGSWPIGWIGFAGMISWGLYLIFKYLNSQKGSGGIESRLIPAVYCLLPGILFGISLILRGYNAFLIFTAVLMTALGLALWRQINWTVLIGFGAISMVIFGFWYLIWGMVVGGAAILLLGLGLKDQNWRTAVLIILLAAIGYSIHIFIPVRSSCNPSIDENKPSRSLAATVGYLERKQYGNVAMTPRMFERRAEWANQFGDYQRMGFWRFLKEQYGFHGGRFFIVLILGLFGVWETIRRKPGVGLPFFLLILVCSVGIVLYMNFADGTRQNPLTDLDYLEVRDRDYFFTPAFAFFGLAIGLGIAGFIELVRDTVKGFGPAIRKAAFGVTSLLILMPLAPLTSNYFVNDRSRNYMPYDYAHNYLRSCPKDAIFISGGDNDTFPIWCIQEVYGIRKDVRPVNLSLGNTDWYIKQIRDKFNIPVGLTDDQIVKLRPFKDQDGVVYHIQDQLVNQILATNKWKYPVCFANAVPPEDRLFWGKPLEDHLILQGMVNTMTPTKGENQVDYEVTRRLYEEEFDYRGISDPTIYKDEASSRLMGNYAQGFLVLADSRRKAGDFEGALRHIRKGLEILPRSADIYLYASQLLAQMGRMDTLRTFVEGASFDEKWKLYFNWGISAKVAGRMDEATEVLELTHRMYPDYIDAFRALVGVYYQNKDFGRLRQTVSNWVMRHPDDTSAADLYRQIQSVDLSRDTAEGKR